MKQSDLLFLGPKSWTQWTKKEPLGSDQLLRRELPPNQPTKPQAWPFLQCQLVVCLLRPRRPPWRSDVLGAAGYGFFGSWLQNYVQYPKSLCCKAAVDAMQFEENASQRVELLEKTKKKHNLAVQLHLQEKRLANEKFQICDLI